MVKHQAGQAAAGVGDNIRDIRYADAEYELEDFDSKAKKEYQLEFLHDATFFGSDAKEQAKGYEDGEVKDRFAYVASRKKAGEREEVDTPCGLAE